jgi:hypothetical protein
MPIQQIISSHPQVRGRTNSALIACIEDCFDCAQACTSCADACLGEPMVEDLRQCIRLNLDTADICTAAGHIASRRTGSNERVLLGVLDACQRACAECAAECDRHAQRMQHCAICAEACWRCEEACRRAIASIGRWQ